MIIMNTMRMPRRTSAGMPIGSPSAYRVFVAGTKTKSAPIPRMLHRDTSCLGIECSVRRGGIAVRPATVSGHVFVLEAPEIRMCETSSGIMDASCCVRKTVFGKFGNTLLLKAVDEDVLGMLVCRWHSESLAGTHIAPLHRLLGVEMEFVLCGMVRVWVDGTKRIPRALMRTAAECTRRKAKLFLCHTTGRLRGSDITRCG